jgi:pimeloyl-ACP methyl ester carboxylesterase
MPPHARTTLRLVALLSALALPGCATTRRLAPDPHLRPCTEAYTDTADGWRLGIRRFCPEKPDPARLPVVLCHGLGLNGTFWTIAGREHLAKQLNARGYDVFVPDMRGSGASHRKGLPGRFNQRVLRETPFLEIGDGDWNVDDQIRYDVPAILDHVERTTGHRRVNWVGHSLGGMLMLAFLETSPQSDRIANFVAMGSTIVQAEYPQTPMLRANRAIRGLLRIVSTGRMARPMMFGRPPGLDKVDRFYYTAANVDKQTVDRFYGYTLENPGRGALHQLDPYLEIGRFLSADRTIDYVAELPRVQTPILMIAGEGDIMSDIPSTYLTFNAISSPDRTLKRYGTAFGHAHDYGHCDLVWSRHAHRDIFPDICDWLDARQPALPSAQQAAAPRAR